MHRKIVSWICVISLVFGLLTVPLSAMAQDKTTTGAKVGRVFASIFLSVFYIPIRFVTCVGTQAVVAPAYLITGDVPGNFKGGTNRKEIAEVSKEACRSMWVVTPTQLRKDYPLTKR